jgi:hypothetical protein
MLRIRTLVFVFMSLAGAAACSSTPTTPTAVTVTVPALASPANGAAIANSSQPVTLTVTNATASDGSAVIDTFEVATDAAFTAKVATSSVPQGSSQTSLTLNSLLSGQQYYWHVRATAGSTVGAFSSAQTFTIGTAIVLQTPLPLSPAVGALVSTQRPALTVTDASRSGPTGTIGYQFEIATDAAFANVIASGTVTETPTLTSFTPSSDLAYSTSYYWHVRTVDTTYNVTSSYFTGASFTTTANIWTGVMPPGTNGHAIRGDNWQNQTLIGYDGTVFQSPTLEMNRLFDLLDRGMSPQGAIDWMHANGYPTDAAYYSGPNVIGIPYIYLAGYLQGNGLVRWDVVLRSGA